MPNYTKLGWIKFSLRTLLLLTGIVAVAFAIVANRANRQNRTLSAIKELGGEYRLANNSRSFSLGLLGRIFGDEAFADVRSVSLRDTAATDELVAELSKLQSLSDIDLSGTQTTDRGVMAISGLPLRVLWLQGCPVTDLSGLYLSRTTTLEKLAMNATECTDQFLANLSPHPNLTNIGLNGTNVTSQGMKFINFFPSLHTLRLYNTEVGDQGMKHIAENDTIRFLRVPKTKISDDSFPHFKSMSKLQEIDLTLCSVSRAAVDRFDAESKCRVIFRAQKAAR